MAPSLQVIIIGAGILGLASAYHILKDQAGLDLLVVDKLAGPGRGDTAKSAAAFRDLFSSPLNRHLSQGSIAFYEEIQNLPNRPTPIGLKKIGYLWLATGEQMERWRQPLARMAQAGVRFQTLEVPELTAAFFQVLAPWTSASGFSGSIAAFSIPPGSPDFMSERW